MSANKIARGNLLGFVLPVLSVLYINLVVCWKVYSCTVMCFHSVRI